MAAVQFLHSIPADDALKLLKLRELSLESQVAGHDAVLHGEKWPNFERIHLIEMEYARALAAAELDWVKGIVADLEAKELTWDEA